MRWFEILETTSDSTFRLKMPVGHQGTDTFHADRLRRYPDNPLPGQAAENPDGEVLHEGGEKEWTVEKMLASRVSHKRLQSQVKWYGSITTTLGTRQATSRTLRRSSRSITRPTRQRQDRL